jgi:hypothetical protein
VTNALDGVVVQLAVGRTYPFGVAGFEGLAQGATQPFGIGGSHLQGFFALLEPEVRGGEAVLAGYVDEGAPFGVGEVRARFARRRYPVPPGGPIAPEGRRRPS